MSEDRLCYAADVYAKLKYTKACWKLEKPSINLDHALTS